MSKTKFKLILQNQYDDIYINFDDEIDLNTYKYQTNLESKVRFLKWFWKIIRWDIWDLRSTFISDYLVLTTFKRQGRGRSGVGVFFTSGPDGSLGCRGYSCWDRKMPDGRIAISINSSFGYVNLSLIWIAWPDLKVNIYWYFQLHHRFYCLDHVWINMKLLCFFHAVPLAWVWMSSWRVMTGAL